MTYARRLAHVTFFAAIAAAGFTAAGAAHAGEAPVRIIELPRVTIVAKRMAPEAIAPVALVDARAVARTPRIIELPPVVVVARRAALSTVLIAERHLRTSGV